MYPPVTPAAPRIDRVIESPLAAPIAVRLHGRRSRGQTLPLVVHFHGGAFVHGGLDSGNTVAGLLAEAGALVMSVDYPLAPAHPFPAALDAGQAALAWAWRHRAALAGAGARLWVAGEEAGGNLAAALALMARDRHEPPLAGQILLSPMLNPCVATASLRHAQAGPVGCRWADGWLGYLARACDGAHPYAAPAGAQRLAGLPQTLIVTAADDPMRDEADAYARRLREAGVAVDELRLPAPTGWPCSCTADAQQAGAATAPPAWSAAVRERFRHVLFDA